jgi:pimeloyl-ACP methyl ester carboxylesterase
MELRDDDLTNFERHGAGPLPATRDQGYVDHKGARIWYATFGAGRSVIMLHGGLGHSGNWGYQVPGLMSSGYQAVLIDSRGHGIENFCRNAFGSIAGDAAFLERMG